MQLHTGSQNKKSHECIAKKSLNVKLISNKQRDRQRGKSVVSSSRFTHFIFHNGSEAFVPVWNTRRVFAEVPLRLNVGLLFYPVVVAETILLLQIHSHYNFEHNTKIFLSCFVTHRAQNKF